MLKDSPTFLHDILGHQVYFLGEGQSEPETPEPHTPKLTDWLFQMGYSHYQLGEHINIMSISWRGWPDGQSEMAALVVPIRFDAVSAFIKTHLVKFEAKQKSKQDFPQWTIGGMTFQSISNNEDIAKDLASQLTSIAQTAAFFKPYGLGVQFDVSYTSDCIIDLSFLKDAGPVLFGNLGKTHIYGGGYIFSVNFWRAPYNYPMFQPVENIFNPHSQFVGWLSGSTAKSKKFSLNSNYEEKLKKLFGSVDVVTQSTNDHDPIECDICSGRGYDLDETAIRTKLMQLLT